MIEIVPYTEATKQHIKTLNYEWLQKYFEVEPNDVIQLTDPQKEIIDKNGSIYYAKHNGNIVGTVSLLKVRMMYMSGENGGFRNGARTRYWQKAD